MRLVPRGYRLLREEKEGGRKKVKSEVAGEGKIEGRSFGNLFENKRLPGGASLRGKNMGKAGGLESLWGIEKGGENSTVESHSRGGKVPDLQKGMREKANCNDKS